MPALIPLDNLTGAALIGLTISAIVYGITLLQTYSYFVDHSKDDGKGLKIFVTLLLILDSFHVALVTHCVYWFTITNFGDYIALLKDVWSLEIQVTVAHILAFLVQAFFAWRIYILSRRRNWWLSAIIMALSTGMLVSSIGYTVTGFQYPYFSQSHVNVPWTIAGLVSELLADCVVMGGMIYYLGTRAHFTRTKRAISKLISYTINTGILATLCTIVTLATYMASKQSMIYVPSFFLLARVYSCSFMSILNSRQTIRGEMYGGSSSSTAFPQEPVAFRNTRSEGASRTQVRVTAETVKDGDSAFVTNKGDIEMV